MEVRLDRPERAARDRRRLADREALEMHQHERLALAARQRADGARDAIAQDGIADRFGPRIRWLSGVVIVLGGLLNMGVFLRAVPWYTILYKQCRILLCYILYDICSILSTYR